MTKQEIRKEMRRRIGEMTAGERAAQAAKVTARLTASTCWQNAETVLLYASMPDEVGTSLLIAQAQRDGKRVVLPTVWGDELRLSYYAEDKVAMSTGCYRIMEPTADAERLESLQAIGLAVIPGRAFTARGERLGRGRGYYDRLMPHLNCPTAGLAFDCQLLASLPTDPWDVPLTCVITASLSLKSEMSV